MTDLDLRRVMQFRMGLTPQAASRALAKGKVKLNGVTLGFPDHMVQWPDVQGQLLEVGTQELRLGGPPVLNRDSCR